MKKVLFVLALIPIVSLSACGNNEKKETISSSKVESLESRVDKLEDSFNSSEEQSGTQTDKSKDEILSGINSDTTKKIVEVFIDNDLKMYNYDSAGIAEQVPADPNDPNGVPVYEDWFTFFTTTGSSGMVLEFHNYSDVNSLTAAYDWYKNKDSSRDSILIKNEKIYSLLHGYPRTDSEKELFNKYKEVFENIK